MAEDPDQQGKGEDQQADPDASADGGSGEESRKSKPGERTPKFVAVAHQFWDTVDSLREVHRAIGPYVAELDTKRLSPEELVAVQGMVPAKQARLAEVIRRMTEAEADDESRDGEKETQAAGSESEEANELTEDDRRFLEEEFGEGPSRMALDRVLFKMRRLGLSPDRKWLLNGSLLTMGVGTFEVMVGALRARRHDLHPDTLERETAEFSLDDLEGFGSISEAEEDLIRRRVDDFLRNGSLTDWLDWFDRVTGLNSRGYAIDIEVVEEAFQRRHVIVHNAGRVSRAYLARSKEGDSADIKLGKPLPVPDEYLTRVFAELDALGTLMIVGAWSKWEPDDETRAMFWLFDHTYESVLAGHWRVTRKLASYGKRLKGIPEGPQLVYQVNEWLANKRLSEFDEVRAEVEQWNTGVLDPRFKLAKCALLDQLDEAFTIAEQAVAAGVLGEEALVEWPLLDEMRQDARFDALLAAVRPEAGSGHVIGPANSGRREGGADSAAEPGKSERTGTAENGGRPSGDA